MGEIVEVDEEDPALPYFVRYEDGDQEDMSHEELASWVIHQDAAKHAKLVEEVNAAAEAAAALQAWEEAARRLFFSELVSWGLEGRQVDGKVGSVIEHVAPASQHLELRRASVRHVVNPVLQAASERKKRELSARFLGAADVNEQYLFHGTSLENSEGIVDKNFCISKVGRTSTMPSSSRVCRHLKEKFSASFYLIGRRERMF